jgi:ArsR family transcriptional regulator, cadmium/lead-responsive transcriptional repressor
MAMISEEHDPSCSADLSAAVALFRSLGDVTRLVIVHELARGERRIVDLTRAVGLAQSTVSAHVACLRDCGLVEGRPQGRQMLYRLTRPELGAVLAAAERLLAATGNAVALCPVYGDPGQQVAGR